MQEPRSQQDQRTCKGATGLANPVCMLQALLVYHDWTTNNRQQLNKVPVPFDLDIGRLELEEAELAKWVRG